MITACARLSELVARRLKRTFWHDNAVSQRIPDDIAGDEAALVAWEQEFVAQTDTEAAEQGKTLVGSDRVTANWSDTVTVDVKTGQRREFHGYWLSRGYVK